MTHHYTINGKSYPLSISTRLIVERAVELGIEVTVIPETWIIRLSYAGENSYFHWQIPSITPSCTEYMVRDKITTRGLLSAAGLQIAKGVGIITADSYSSEIIGHLQIPLIVKPRDNNGGRGITTDITQLEAVQPALELALENTHTEGAVIEEQFTGTEYRVLCTRETVLAVTQRVPAHVVGDGHSTISALIDQRNTSENRVESFAEGSRITLKKDAQTIQHLATQQYNLTTIPKKNERVYLRTTSNLSQGGDSIDFTDRVHPSIKQLALRAIGAIPGLELAGIDIMTKDVTAEQTLQSYIIVEVNASPGLFMHQLPSEGNPRDVTTPFLRIMFPSLKV